MNVLEGALAFSLGVMMYLLRFVLAALVLWLILGGVKETVLAGLLRRQEETVRPRGRDR